MTMTVEEALAEAEYRKKQNPFATVRLEAVLVLVDELRRLRAENAMLTKQRDEHAQNSANATTQCIAYQQEIADLREQLAQERKRLDWALETSATFYEWEGKHYLSYDLPGGDGFDAIKTDSPRSTIDELIDAEAEGGGK